MKKCNQQLKNISAPCLFNIISVVGGWLVLLQTSFRHKTGLHINKDINNRYFLNERESPPARSYRTLKKLAIV